jgi:hypothetical protein
MADLNKQLVDAVRSSKDIEDKYTDSTVDTTFSKQSSDAAADVIDSSAPMISNSIMSRQEQRLAERKRKKFEQQMRQKYNIKDEQFIEAFEGLQTSTHP